MAGNAAAAASACESHELGHVVVDATGQDHHAVVDVDRLLVNLVVATGGHAMDILLLKPKEEEAAARCCVVCTEPMRWVAIGRCGHAVVCNKCMVKTRFFQQNKRCCVCKAHCPKVLVTKAHCISNDDTAATTTAVSKLPRLAFRDGRVGKYWYHGYTRAYFEEEKEYQAARAECQGIIPSFFEPWCLFAVWFGFHLAIGAAGSIGFAIRAKNLTSQVGVIALSIFVMLLVATFFWSIPKTGPYDPYQLEEWRLKKIRTSSAN